MKTERQIRALGFNKSSDAEVVSRGLAVCAGMMGNTNYPHPPIDLAALKAEIDTFAARISDALDGGSKAITARDKQRDVVVKMLHLLARYVEMMCNNNMAAFTFSGFQAAFTTRTPAQPLAQPSIRNIDQDYGSIAGIGEKCSEGAQR